MGGRELGTFLAFLDLLSCFFERFASLGEGFESFSGLYSVLQNEIIWRM